VVLVAAAALIAAGCGGGDDSSSSGAATTSSGSTGSSAKAPTGTPYKLGLIDDDPTQPEEDIFKSAQASAKDINDAGGVNGRPVSVEHCGAQVNQNAAAACARKFASDSSIIATVGNFMANGQGATPILEKAGLASVGNYATQPEDYSCDSCFPMSFASLGGPLGATTALTDTAKAKKIGMLFIDVPAARSYVQLIQGALRTAGRDAQLTKTIFVPAGTTSFAGVVAQFESANVDGVVLGIPVVMVSAFLRQVAQQGYDKPIGVSATASLTALGKLPPAATKNVVLTSAFRRQGDLYDKIIQDQKDAGVEVGNDEAVNAYLSVQLFKNIVDGKPDLDRKGIAGAANAMAPFDFGGMTGQVDYSKAQTFLGGQFKRLVPSTWYYRYKGGTDLEPAVSGDPEFDVFKAPAGG